jgi:uncharacterized protein
MAGNAPAAIRRVARRAKSTHCFAMLVFTAMALLTAPQWAVAKQTVPQTRFYVADPDHILDDATRKTLEEQLKELEAKTTAQVKILCLRSTDEEDLFTFTQRHFRDWQLGTKEKKNGAIIALAVQEHKVRVHTGYGLEGTLPDIWCADICRQAATEFFKQGDYNGGIKKITAGVATRIADELDVKLSGVPPVHFSTTAPTQPANDGATFIMMLVFFIVVVYFVSRSKGQSNWWGFLFNTIASGYSGGFSGGGSSGGGGSFGGGGSSGGGGGGASW